MKFFGLAAAVCLTASLYAEDLARKAWDLESRGDPAGAQDFSSQDVLAALARNVVTNGYQALSSSEGLDQTEYLKLVIRYLSQARELDKLAGKDKVIRLEACESANTADLLKVLGYRMRG